MENRAHPRSRRAAVALLLAVALGWGCAGVLGDRPAYQYFVSPDPDDAWSHKIRGWQTRERADPPRPTPAVSEVVDPLETLEEQPGDLRAKYQAFRAAHKRAVARELADWIQREARQHYVDDGAVDHWATFQETLRTNGDDCDGLELLSFYLLRDLGFRDEEVFRAIVFRRSDGQHHMVTLWFEDPEDPWVIDPTGAMTTGMPRMSELPEWVPLKVFDDQSDFSVREASAAR